MQKIVASIAVIAACAACSDRAAVTEPSTSAQVAPSSASIPEPQAAASSSPIPKAVVIEDALTRVLGQTPAGVNANPLRQALTQLARALESGSTPAIRQAERAVETALKQVRQGAPEDFQPELDATALAIESVTES